MNKSSFNFTYFFDTLVERILFVASKFPTIYTTLITVIILLLFGITDNNILFGALIVGAILKIVFTISSKQKTLRNEIITISFDILVGLSLIVLSGNVMMYIVVIISILYLFYYATIMTVSYSRLGSTSEQLLSELKKRNEKQFKNKGKRK
jgi:hypothetical protein